MKIRPVNTLLTIAPDNKNSKNGSRNSHFNISFKNNRHEAYC